MAKGYLWVITAILVPVVLVMTACNSSKSTPTPVPSAAPTSTSSGATPAITPTAVVTPTPAPPDGTPSGAVPPLEAAVEAIYAQVNPSVVNIQVQTSAGQALGSGFVWDKQGHIVTNNHVVDGATRMKVTFADDTIVYATLVGTDVDSDLAVIKVNVADSVLHPVQLADSTKVKVGQLSVAFGNPFGFQGTMTVGFISAVGRSLPVSSTVPGQPGYSIPAVIQTDAAINPGNSGGVLVDDQGRVMGVPSDIISPSGSSSGVGFAIPSVIVRKVVPSLISSGTYIHSYLGISGTSLDPDVDSAMGLPASQRGALVVTVVSGGPSDKAGLHGGNQVVSIFRQQVTVGGDVIISVDNQPVKAFDDLTAYLAVSTDVGQKVNLTILRDGKQMSVTVTLEARPRQ